MHATENRNYTENRKQKSANQRILIKMWSGELKINKLRILIFLNFDNFKTQSFDNVCTIYLLTTGMKV